MTIEVMGSFRGQDVHGITLRSGAGATAKILTWGATIADLVVPWRGAMQRVVLGLRSLDDYVQYSPHMGALAGRFANRIRNGHFDLDGKGYDLPRNFLGKHCLHGGGEGFGKRTWQIGHVGDNSVTLTLVSPGGDAGFPGNLSVTCRYALLEPAIFNIEVMAMSDRPTPLNLASHSYFNLDGEPTIEHHTLQLEADFHTGVDDERVATGEIRPVADTPYDFRTPREVVARAGDGTLFPYDMNFCMRGARQHQPARTAVLTAVLTSKRNGLSMELWTDQPGVQFYDGHNVNIPVAGLHGRPYGPRSGLCLEPQFYPNSPNVPHFPDCVLRPGECYRQVTQFRFGARSG